MKKNQKYSTFAFLIFSLVFFASSASAALTQNNEVGASLEVTPFVTSLLLVVVVIGVLYNLWKTTRAFGGIIGEGLRRVGLGILLLVVEALDRAAISFGSEGVISGVVPSNLQSSAHDFLFMLGLFFVAMGFIKLSTAAK